MMPLFLQPLRKYADFAGRARRAEYWSFALLVIGPWALIVAIADEDPALAKALLIPFLLTLLVLFTPLLAAQVRRLHDTQRSGWWSLLSLVPLVGWALLLIWLTEEGTPGDNRFGPDPTGRPSPPPGVIAGQVPLYLQPFQRWSDFKGRARRTEYWQFVVVTASLGSLLAMLASSFSAGVPVLPLACLIVFVGLLVPLLAAQVRRLHDTGHSGWWVFIALVPVLGSLIILFLLTQDGTRGDNRFGPDPKGRPSPPSRPPQVATPGAGIVTS